MCIDGLTAKDIADYCNKQGWKTKQYKLFTSKAVIRIITQPKYKGTMIYNSYKDYSNLREPLTEKSEIIIKDNAFDEIINTNKWELAQEKLLLHERGNYMWRNKDDHILSGLVFCGKCSENLQGYSSIKQLRNGDASEYRAYVCKSKKIKDQKCDLKQIKKSLLEELVFHIIKQFLMVKF